MFIIYDIFFITNYVNNKLVDKFVVFTSLKEGADVEELTKQVKLKLKTMHFKEISYIDKQQVFNLVRSETELYDILDILRTNPFFDVLKFKISNFCSAEFTKVLDVLKTNPEVKDVIYDKNLLSYITQLEKILKLYKIFFVCVIVYIIVIFILFLPQIQTIKVPPVLIFTAMYVLLIFINNKILNFITKCTHLIDINATVVYVITYITSLTHLVHIEIKEQKQNV